MSYNLVPRCEVVVEILLWAESIAIVKDGMKLFEMVRFYQKKDFLGKIVVLLLFCCFVYVFLG